MGCFPVNQPQKGFPDNNRVPLLSPWKIPAEAKVGNCPRKRCVLGFPLSWWKRCLARVQVNEVPAVVSCAARLVSCLPVCFCASHGDASDFHLLRDRPTCS